MFRLTVFIVSVGAGWATVFPKRALRRSCRRCSIFRGRGPSGGRDNRFRRRRGHQGCRRSKGQGWVRLRHLGPGHWHLPQRRILPRRRGCVCGHPKRVLFQSGGLEFQDVSVTVFVFPGRLVEFKDISPIVVCRCLLKRRKNSFERAFRSACRTYIQLIWKRPLTGSPVESGLTYFSCCS